MGPFMNIEHDAAARKARPIFSGVLRYFPRALGEVAHCSKVGNDQHNPGQPLHWDKSKSSDELDALVRHLADHASGEVWDTSGTEPVRHLTKVIWRALAALERELEAAAPPHALPDPSGEPYGPAS
jgi:hypothetical protein